MFKKELKKAIKEHPGIILTILLAVGQLFVFLYYAGYLLSFKLNGSLLIETFSYINIIKAFLTALLIVFLIIEGMYYIYPFITIINDGKSRVGKLKEWKWKELLPFILGSTATNLLFILILYNKSIAMSTIIAILVEISLFITTYFIAKDIEKNAKINFNDNLTQKFLVVYLPLVLIIFVFGFGYLIGITKDDFYIINDNKVVIYNNLEKALIADCEIVNDIITIDTSKISIINLDNHELQKTSFNNKEIE